MVDFFFCYCEVRKDELYKRLRNDKRLISVSDLSLKNASKTSTT